ncbi:MAG: phage holin family protein [Myxococcaceae bacterium]
MKNLLIRICVNAAALWLAAVLIPGLALKGDPISVLIVALVFGLVNAFIRPVVMILSLPAVILTLGFFTLVVNALMLWVTSAFTHRLYVGGFWPAFWGGLVISVVSAVLSNWLKDGKRARR